MLFTTEDAEDTEDKFEYLLLNNPLCPLRPLWWPNKITRNEIKPEKPHRLFRS